jgi:hypothetical protein
MVSYNCALDIDVAFLADRHRDPRCVEIKQVSPRAAAPSGYERTTHIVIHPGQPMTRPHAHRHPRSARALTAAIPHVHTEAPREIVMRSPTRRGVSLRAVLSAQAAPLCSGMRQRGPVHSHVDGSHRNWTENRALLTAPWVGSAGGGRCGGRPRGHRCPAPRRRHRRPDRPAQPPRRSPWSRR